ATGGWRSFARRAVRRQVGADLRELRSDALRQEPQAREVRDHRGVHVTFEELAKRRVVVPRRDVTTVALGLPDLGPAEPRVLVGLAREEASDRIRDGESRAPRQRAGSARGAG